MLKVEDYAEIRRARRDGMTIREISRTFRQCARFFTLPLDAPPAPFALVSHSCGLASIC